MSRKLSNESVNFLSDELHSTINMLKLALLALENEEDELVPSAIEEAYAKLQSLIDEYCVERGNATGNEDDIIRRYDTSALYKTNA